MAPSLQAQSPPTPHPNLSSFYHVTPTYPSFATPLCIIYCQEKGTETRKEGSRKGGAVHPLTHNQTQGAWECGKALVPSPSLLETRIAEVGPHKSKIDYCFNSPVAAGDRDPTFTVCVNIYICAVYVTYRYTHIDISYITPWVITPT